MQKSEKKKKLFSLEYIAYDFVKLTAALPGLIYFRPKIIYESEQAKEKIRGGAVLISNHAGFIDPLYIMYTVWYRRHHFICKKELLASKMGFALKLFRCIPIDRDNFSVGSFRVITDSLSSGKLVSMFPEGQVNDGKGQISAFKSGMVLMAMRANVPIVPVFVKKRQHFWQRLRVVIGNRVNVNELCGSRPSFSMIEDTAKMLHDKEKELEKLS